MLRILAVASSFAFSACQAYTDDDLAIVKAGPICAAGPRRKEMGPKVLIGQAGDKACTNVASTPDEFIAMTTSGMAYISSDDADGTQYMTNSSLVTLSQTSGDGYFLPPTLEPNATDNSTPQYGFFSFGTDVGNTSSTAYGYIGMAAYVMVQGEMSFQNNTFMIQTDHKELCAVPIQAAGANTACGAPRTVTAGDFKFSLFGYGAGADIAQMFTTVGHLGVRTTINHAHMGANATVTFNGNVAAAAIGTTQIQSMSIAAANSTLSFSFPQWFNYGLVTGAGQEKKGSEQVKIRHVASTMQNEFYIDYLFPKTADGIGQNRGWFVYDPTVATTPSTSPTPAPASASPTPAPAPGSPTPAPTPAPPTPTPSSLVSSAIRATAYSSVRAAALSLVALSAAAVARA